MTKFSIIIPTCNRPIYLLRLLRSIKKQTYNNIEVIIVTSSSKKNLIIEKTKILNFKTKMNFKLKYIVVEKQNKSAQINLGYRFISKLNKYFAIVDDDCFLKRDWVESTVKLHKKFTEFLAIGGGYINNRNNTLINRWFNNYICSVKEIDLKATFFLGGNISFKKKLFQKYKLKYNDRYNVCEDWDLSQAIIQAKQKIMLHPKINIYHTYRDTVFKSLKRFEEYGYGEYFIAVNYPYSTLPTYLDNTLLDIVRIIKKAPDLFYCEFKSRIKKATDYQYLVSMFLYTSAKIVGYLRAVITSILLSTKFPTVNENQV